MANVFIRALASGGATAVDDLRDRQRKAHLEQLKLMDARRERHAAEIGFSDTMKDRALAYEAPTPEVAALPQAGLSAAPMAAPAPPAAAVANPNGLTMPAPAAPAAAAVGRMADSVQQFGVDMQGGKPGDPPLRLTRAPPRPASTVKASPKSGGLMGPGRIFGHRTGGDTNEQVVTPEQAAWDRMYSTYFNPDGTPSKRGLALDAAKRKLGGAVASAGGAVKSAAGKVPKTMPNTGPIMLPATATVANPNIPEVGAKLLNLISSTEAGGYDVIYGKDNKFTDFADHPRRDIPITKGPNTGKMSSAAGKYQFIKGTWDEQAAKLGLKDFSPASQDAAAWNLAKEEYAAKTGGDLEERLAQGGDVRDVVSALSGRWTSLPGGIEQSKAYGSKAGVSEIATKPSAVNAIMAAKPGAPVKLPSFKQLELSRQANGEGGELRYAREQAEQAVAAAQRARTAGSPMAYQAAVAKVEQMNIALRRANNMQAVADMELGNASRVDAIISEKVGADVKHQLLDDGTVAVYYKGELQPERLTVSELADDVREYFDTDFRATLAAHYSKIAEKAAESSVKINEMMVQGTIDAQIEGIKGSVQMSAANAREQGDTLRTVLTNTNNLIVAKLKAGQETLFNGSDGNVYVGSPDPNNPAMVNFFRLDQSTMKLDGKKITVDTRKKV